LDTANSFAVKSPGLRLATALFDIALRKRPAAGFAVNSIQYRREVKALLDAESGMTVPSDASVELGGRDETGVFKTECMISVR
jgi:hypothetical protein